MGVDVVKSSRVSTVIAESHDDQSSVHPKTVGGHAENFSQRDGFLVKKTNCTEGRFYESIIKAQYGLSAFVPNCADVKFVKQKDQEFANVTIEDLREGFSQPIIFDVKLGSKTFSSKEFRNSIQKPSDKLRKELASHLADAVTSSSKRGYRFVGSSTSNESRRHLGTHPDEMIHTMKDNIRTEDLNSIVKQLDELENYLLSKEGRRFEMIGASLLIVAESITSETRKTPRVKLIDFAHSNVIGGNGFRMGNGVFTSPHRREIYQRGFRHGVEMLTADLKNAIND